MVERLANQLRTSLKPLGVKVGEIVEHNGFRMSALVQFEAGSSDLFVIKLMLSDRLCASGLELIADVAWSGSAEDGVKMELGIMTPTLSLKNITRSENTPACHSSTITDTSGYADFLAGGDMINLDEIFIKAGRQPDEPKFALSWFQPNSAHRPDTAPTIQCAPSASLVWPFELNGYAVVGPHQQNEDFVFAVCELPSFFSNHAALSLVVPAARPLLDI